MIGWQKFLDEHFPNGAVMRLGPPDDEMFFHIPRIWVFEDAPAPLVGYHALEAPQQPSPHRLVTWSVVRNSPYLVTSSREDGVQLRFSADLSDQEIQMMADYRSLEPVL